MNRILRGTLTCGLIVITSMALFTGGLALGHFTARPADTAPQLDLLLNLEASGPTAAEDKLMAPFWEAWDLVHQEYVDQPVDDTKLAQGAIRGMMAALGDPHSSYMNPTEYEIEVSNQSGDLQGIGAYVEAAGDYLRIVSPFPGSPAEAAGLRPGDLIIKVDGVDVAGLGEFEIISRVRGPEGTTVHLTIQREGEKEPLEFTLVRARIHIPSVESKMLDGNVAYVKVNDFGDKTTAELKDALKSLEVNQPVGLVLDLRGNPGGYLNTAIEVVSQFISDGVVMREKYGDGRERTYEAIPDGLATQIPLVVLIDKGSASASEIVAGAIQDTRRGTIVGEKSYGKGSVQNWRELRGDNGAVRVTIARWLTPSGRSIHQVGITPDVAVEMTEDDHAAERDPQLDKAVSILTSSAGAVHPFARAALLEMR
ncbi:MAG TPA: S41 family peptidase [Anaerolineales bacterium]|nr:S41 family peptidase [Anaerolineales bacterium]